MAGIQLSGTIFGRSCSVLLERRSASRPWMAKRHIPPATRLGWLFCLPAAPVASGDLFRTVRYAVVREFDTTKKRHVSRRPGTDRCS